MKKKVLALFLSAALCVTLLPATGMAAEFGSGDAEIVENAANSQEMFSAEETTEPMGETEQPAEDSMEEETAEATSTSDPELTVTPAVTPTADPEPTCDTDSDTNTGAQNKRKMDRRKMGKPQFCKRDTAS